MRARERSGEAATPSDYPPLPEALVVPVYDNHTHLEIEDGVEPVPWREQLDRASSVGVRGVVQVGTDLETSRWSADLAALDPRVLAAVAIHPDHAVELGYDALNEQLTEIDALAQRPRVRAVGETGLDFAHATDDEARAVQRHSFEAHIEIAKNRDLALQIHDRDAHREVLDVLRRVGAPERTVFHCFSGDAEFAQLVAEEGWYLSFSGTVTFKNAGGLREALEAVPRARLLVETDAPYLTPHPFRGRPNSSYLIPHTVRAMAAHLGTDASMLAAQISSNTEEVYGHWDDEPLTPPPGPFDPPTGAIELPPPHAG
ncbi:MAG: TatD family hydrolase [Actinomycetales bacterium]|nr:TatD family hydrolase [Actinomycetales bacterium]